jgi:trans-aconitate methyltransferase
MSKKLSNSKFYKKAIEEFGVSPQGVHWNSKYSQYKRFEVITKLIKKEITTSTVVDVGCGFAEYVNYLSHNNKLPKKFIGIDCEEKMVNISKKRFPDIEFHQRDVLKDELFLADYYVASGALNILTIDEVELFIDRCYTNATKGFIFNFLKDFTFTNIDKKREKEKREQKK